MPGVKVLIYLLDSRSQIFFQVGALGVFVEFACPPIAALLMERTGDWVPYMLSLALQVFAFALSFTMPETLDRDKTTDSNTVTELPNGTTIPPPRTRNFIKDRLASWGKGAADSARFVWEDKNVAILLAMLSLMAFGKQSLFQILLIYVSKRFDLTIAQVSACLPPEAAGMPQRNALRLTTYGTGKLLVCASSFHLLPRPCYSPAGPELLHRPPSQSVSTIPRLEHHTSLGGAHFHRRFCNSSIRPPTTPALRTRRIRTWIRTRPHFTNGSNIACSSIANRHIVCHDHCRRERGEVDSESAACCDLYLGIATWEWLAGIAIFGHGLSLIHISEPTRPY